MSLIGKDGNDEDLTGEFQEQFWYIPGKEYLMAVCSKRSRT